MRKFRKSRKQPSKSVEVKVNVPLTSTSFMSLLLITLISLVGYSGYLGVNSVWKFTHPQFNFSVDSVKSLAYIAKGLKVPPLPGPNFSIGSAPQESATATYLQSVAEFKSQFRAKFPDSKLADLSDNEILNMGWEMCKAKEQSLSKNNGTYSRDDIISAFQAKLIFSYPTIRGLNEFVAGVGNKAFDNLCGGN